MSNTKLFLRYICILSLFIFTGCLKDKSPLGIIIEHPWKESSPESQNLNGKKLFKLNKKITSGEYGEINSLIILRNSRLVFEKYYRGYIQNDLHCIYSVTKGFTSALIGLLLNRQGGTADLNTKLITFFPEFISMEKLDQRKREITVEHLLTMTAGFEWDEWTETYESPQNDMYRLVRSENWMKFILDLPMSNQPGTQFIYNSGCTILLSYIIQKSFGKSAENFAKENLFDQINLNYWIWKTCPNGITNTGWGLHLTPLDMLRFGYLYLNDGRWEENQIVPVQWITTSVASKVNINTSYNYGYQWWRFTDQSSVAQVLETNDLFFAWGYGGQFVFVIPHLNMVVVSTAANFSNSTQTIHFLRDYILTAVTD